MEYPLPLRAWTGGDTWRDADIGDRTAPVFRAMRRALLREALAVFGVSPPDRDTLRILRNRARADAWRSYTEHKRTERKETKAVEYPHGFLKGSAVTLNAYALRCGGVQSDESIGNWRVELYQEHSAYHVRSLDYKKRDAGEPLSTWRTWLSFPCGKLADARRAYRGMVRTFRAQGN
jgi:hypothetical protein